MTAQDGRSSGDAAAAGTDAAVKCNGAKTRLAEAAAAFPGLNARLMFGTDWFMLAEGTEPQA
jgi:hypothetical protein